VLCSSWIRGSCQKLSTILSISIYVHLLSNSAIILLRSLASYFLSPWRLAIPFFNSMGLSSWKLSSWWSSSRRSWQLVWLLRYSSSSCSSWFTSGWDCPGIMCSNSAFCCVRLQFGLPSLLCDLGLHILGEGTVEAVNCSELL
jgi:hypothetical protein